MGRGLLVFVVIVLDWVRDDADDYKIIPVTDDKGAVQKVSQAHGSLG
jgi:hypothetical protein